MKAPFCFTGRAFAQPGGSGVRNIIQMTKDVNARYFSMDYGITVTGLRITVTGLR